ncbi:MAG: S-layer homology domain-containing protein, partial [Firmicutes bacterium]|nr:S-layer homology domain-containing protein [Bacillota bacterium]
MSKKIVAMLMAVAMAFSLLPVTAFAADTTPTPDVVGGYYNNDNQWVQGEQARSDELQDTVTTVNKTATKVADQDNQYEVTLKVEMKHKETAVQPGAAATVLVIDKSGSMNENNRLSAAKTAAINFLKRYSGFSDSDFTENGSLKNNVSDKNLKRYVSLVTFNDSASVKEWGKNKESWIDVSTKDGYNNLFDAINKIKASDGTNLDAALRLANTQMQSGSITQIDKSKRNVIALTDGVPTYYVSIGTGWFGNDENVSQHGSYGCPDTNAVTTSSATALKDEVNAVYTVCFGAANDICWTEGSVHAAHIIAEDEKHATDGPMVGDFLKDSIATPSTNEKQYAYNADDPKGLYQAFAAITQTITEGLNEGVVTDGLPTGVTAVEGSGFVESWELKSDEATLTQDGEYNVYTYTKTYRVNVDPATVNTVAVNGVNYAPLNTPTTLTVQNGDEEVKIPFPIPAGKVTYSLTGFDKALVTDQNKPEGLMIPKSVTIPANTTTPVVVKEDESVTLLYKITVQGNPGAKFTVTDDGATLVSPTDNSITENTTNNTFSGTVGNTGNAVFYVSKHFDVNGSAETVSNTATIAPGDNAKGPTENTKTVKTEIQKIGIPDMPDDPPDDPKPEPFGKVTITKNVEGLTLNQLPDTFKIKLTPEADRSVEFGKESLENGTLTKTYFVRAGTYTVSEENADVSGYNCITTYSLTGTGYDATNVQASKTFTVTGNQDITVTVTNTYTKTTNTTVELSNLIKKELTVKDGSTLPDNTTFSVKVTPTGTQTAITGTTTSEWGTPNEAGDTTYTVPFDFDDNGTLSLPEGTYTYTVQEDTTNPISGMQYDSKEYTLTITVNNGSYTATYATDDTAGATTTPVTTNSPLTIKNTYQTPDLTVEKKTVSVAGKTVDRNTVAHVGEQIVWEVSVTNNKTTPASTQLKDTLGGVTVYNDENLRDTVNLGKDGTWTATVSANDTVTYYVTYTVQKTDIPNGEIVNAIVKDGNNNNPINSDPVSTWDTKQRKSATSLSTSDWTTTVTLTLPTVNENKAETTVATGTVNRTVVTPIIAISRGSHVIDQIGNEFTFVPELTLKVGAKTYTGEKDGDTNTYNFGAKDGEEYPYTVTYTAKNGETPAQFTWNINEDVYAGTEVTLSYKLKLANPKTAAGTYGVEDLNGNGQIEQGKTPLYTNESATLYKDKQEIAVFPKPSVSYIVKSSSGSHSGGSRPSLNTKDHYGYIIGYPVDYYTGQPTTDQTKKPVRPEGKITRAEVATIYFRMLTDESRTKFWSQSNSYSDVKAGDWFNNAVSTLSNAGIIAGYEDGSFRPNGYITRAEFATIAARFFDVTYNGKDLFPDISGHWAKDYINQAANKGFVNGY